MTEGKLCIVDVSQLRGGPSLILSGLILRRIFDRNQEEFTKAEPKTIPTIAVVEEAQTVLNEQASASTPYIEWIKEGRKYDLGAVLITQQPGAIPTEILSQGDNWFVFHLLSAADLQSLQRANAHFSGDLLSVLLNEPITGQGIFWSSTGNTIYPIPLRVLSFEHLYTRLDKEYDRPAIAIYAKQLREKYAGNLAHLLATVMSTNGMASSIDIELETAQNSFVEPNQSVDPFRLHQEQAIGALKTNKEFMQALEQDGIPWGKVVGLLKEALPGTMDDRDNVAYNLVPKALNEILGERDEAWRTERRGTRGTTFIVKK